MTETILIVDDDEDVRSIARQALSVRKYIALETGDPQQAIRMAKEQRIDLLLTDVVMPLMNGTELADRIQAVSASTKVLLMSGYQTSAITRQGGRSWPSHSASTSWPAACGRRWTDHRPSLGQPRHRPPPCKNDRVGGPGEGSGSNWRAYSDTLTARAGRRLMNGGERVEGRRPCKRFGSSSRSVSAGSW
jgi:CheY-like chemotaxis protein